ncbi:MAG: response regulator transcription factor [Anaerovoracaceae bacterium]
MTEYIIITEDDRALARGLERALDKEGRDITLCAGLDEARTALETGNCDLMILDVNLPDGSGFDFLREIREKSDVPVMMLTVNDMETDIVSGLEAGADDYMTKPFSLAVLRARVNTLLRRRRRVRRAVRIDGYSFDFDAMEFFHEGRRVELSKTEQRLLRALVDNAGTALTRGQLVDRIWTDGAEYVDENALSVAVKRLRDKLEASKYIKTVYGIGYKWEGKDG